VPDDGGPGAGASRQSGSPAPGAGWRGCRDATPQPGERPA